MIFQINIGILAGNGLLAPDTHTSCRIFSWFWRQTFEWVESCHVITWENTIYIFIYRETVCIYIYIYIVSVYPVYKRYKRYKISSRCNSYSRYSRYSIYTHTYIYIYNIQRYYLILSKTSPFCNIWGMMSRFASGTEDFGSDADPVRNMRKSCRPAKLSQGLTVCKILRPKEGTLDLSSWNWKFSLENEDNGFKHLQNAAPFGDVWDIRGTATLVFATWLRTIQVQSRLYASCLKRGASKSKSHSLSFCHHCPVSLSWQFCTRLRDFPHWVFGVTSAQVQNARYIYSNL